ncbi:hypothetical protein SAMN05660413_00503 [Salegentibacter flavus]|uniref:Uncharacterized protein n=1 Tax=Salegentibacter flavus TaxID=287099 RepID=A0A1I4Y414_9FLAO|nr:hypothetical protein SAMN05660413_00503 [Salegentibacter flavus]
MSILSFFARPKNETKNGAFCGGIFWLQGQKTAHQHLNFLQGPSSSLRTSFRKFLTVPMRYTHKRGSQLAKLAIRHHPKLNKILSHLTARKSWTIKPSCTLPLAANRINQLTNPESQHHSITQQHPPINPLPDMKTAFPVSGPVFFPFLLQLFFIEPTGSRGSQ